MLRRLLRVLYGHVKRCEVISIVYPHNAPSFLYQQDCQGERSLHEHLTFGQLAKLFATPSVERCTASSVLLPLSNYKA